MPDNDAKLLNRFRRDVDPDEKRYAFGSQICDDPVILEVTDKKTGRKLAVKQQVLDIQTEEQRKEVEREVLSLEKIANDHVIRMHKHILVRGEKTLYQFMDLFRKTPLHTFVETLPQESNHFETYLDLTAQLLDGITAVHSEKIVHRDLKPGNILVDQTEKGLDLRIIDFGLSVPAYTPYSRTYGTPGYMDPKTKTGTTATARTDIFALGVILYDLFAGNLRRGRTFGTQMLSTKLAEATRTKDEKQAELLCKVNPETLQDTPEKYRKNISEIINCCLHPVELRRYFDVNTAALDFHLLPLSEKRANILEKLKNKDGFSAINEGAEAYNECVPARFRPYSMRSVCLEEVNVAIMSVINAIGSTALLPYIRMLAETGKLEAEKKTIETYSVAPFDRLLATATTTKQTAQAWLDAIKTLTPDGKALWTRFSAHFHIPIDTLEKHLTEAAKYEAKNSAEACVERGMQLIKEQYVQNAAGRHLQTTAYETATLEFKRALTRNPAHPLAKENLLSTLFWLAERYRGEDAKRARENAEQALELQPTAKTRSKLYYILENSAENTEDSFQVLKTAVADPVLRTDAEELARTKGRLVQRALVMNNCPELTAICQDYVETVRITQEKAQMNYSVFQAQTLARAHHHLKNWTEAANYAGLTLPAFQNRNSSFVEDILEESLRQLKLNALVDKMKRSYNIDVRPILDVPLVDCGIDRTAEQITKDACTMSIAFGKACKGMPQEALDMLVTELREKDYTRSEYLAKHVTRSIKSLHHPEHFLLPRRAQKRRMYITGALIGAAVVSGAFGLAKGLHIWPFNQPAVYQQK